MITWQQFVYSLINKSVCKFPVLNCVCVVVLFIDSFAQQLHLLFHTRRYHPCRGALRGWQWSEGQGRREGYQVDLLVGHPCASKGWEVDHKRWELLGLSKRNGGTGEGTLHTFFILSCPDLILSLFPLIKTLILHSFYLCHTPISIVFSLLLHFISSSNVPLVFALRMKLTFSTYLWCVCFCSKFGTI